MNTNTTTTTIKTAVATNHNESRLRTALAAAALLSTTAFAHATEPFVANSHWSGFQVSTASGVNSARLDVSNNPKVGTLAISGHNVPVSITCTATGDVDLQGLGVPYAGLHAVGVVAAQGGTFSLAASYKLSGVPTMHDGAGRLSLLRSYATVAGGTTGGGSSAANLYPPDPCFGSFASAYGTIGRIVVEHSPPSEHTPPSDTVDHAPPSDFNGRVSFGELQYAVVGTINPLANADGSHDMAMLGANLDPNSITPCVKPGDIVPCVEPSSLVSCFNSYGLLVPAVRTGGAARLMGSYALSGMRGTVDTGKFQLGQ